MPHVGAALTFETLQRLNDVDQNNVMSSGAQVASQLLQVPRVKSMLQYLLCV
jgi:hypothetical protein